MMNSDKKPEPDLEDEFQRTLSLDNILQEMTQEDSELENLYLKSLDDLPVIDDFYVDSQDHSSGGMKRIELAIDKSSGRKVALAWPKAQDLSLKDKMIFLNEARISSILEHPNIIPIYQIGRNQHGLPVFAMKWLDGLNLEQCLSGEGNKKSLQDLLGILIKVCEAVEYAHALGVIHLDLKPGNILLGDFGEVLVLDWGIARLVKTTHFKEDEVKIHESIERFLNRQLRGTPEYISPEQHSGAELSTSMDIYAMGNLIKDVLNYCSTEISQSDFNTINSIASKASAKQVKERYESVNDLKKDIQDFLLGFAVEAESPGAIKLLHLFINRHKPVFYTTSIAILVLIIFTLIFINNLRKSEASERESRKRAEKALKDYKKENELKKDLLERLSFHSSDEQREQQYKLNFKEAEKQLEYLTELDSNNASIWLQLGRLKLAHMDFERSIKCLEKAEEIYGSSLDLITRLKRIARKYKDKVDWHKSDYIEFLGECRGIEYLEASFCSFIYSKMNIEEQMDIFSEAIKLRNPKALLRYELNESTANINLSSSEKLGNLSVAAGLSIEKLNLSNSNGASLKFFQNRHLKHVDISHTNIDNLWEIPSLKELTAKNLKSNELIARKHIWSNLRKIDLSGSHMRDWHFLNDCEKLEVLEVSNSNFTFKKIRIPPKLEKLVVNETQIADRIKQKLQEHGVTIEYK